MPSLNDQVRCVISCALDPQFALEVDRHGVRSSAPVQAIRMGRSGLSCLGGTFPVPPESFAPSAPSCGAAKTCADPAVHETLPKGPCSKPTGRGLARS